MGPHGVTEALAAIAAGRPVIVTDESGPAGQGQLMMAADAVSTDTVAFFLEHTVGLIGVALPAQRLDELGIPLMVDDPMSDTVALSVSVDVLGAGVSAEGRARTIRALADPASGAEDFSRPGAVFPLRARSGGPSSTSAGTARCCSPRSSGSTVWRSTSITRPCSP